MANSIVVNVVIQYDVSNQKVVIWVKVVMTMVVFTH